MFKISTMMYLGFLLLCLQLLALPASAKTHNHTFVIEETPYARLCETKNTLTVNGQFPGPTIKARKGDSVIVRVHNHGDYNITLHCDNAAATAFTAGLRSLSPADVPQTIDQRIIITIAVNTLSRAGHSCQSPKGDRLAASLNNISFATPEIDILDAYYNHIKGVYGDNFPSRPPFEFNYTGDNLPPSITRAATEVKVLEYNTSLEVVFQDTNILAAENHPMHLHGQSFYVVGRGFGNYEEDDASAYNLVDPPHENTVGVPRGGWAAIRFRAKNPGVWLMHCHLDIHYSWGMNTVFIVKDGVNPDEKMLPPPADMPPC